MTDDLSTRLLEEIAAKERAVKRVMEGAWWLNDYIDEAGQAWLDEWANEALALRLCQAHREIVELAMVCQADYALASERLANYPGWTEGLSQPTDLEAAVATAFARFQLSEHYLSIISRGYNLKEGE